MNWGNGPGAESGKASEGSQGFPFSEFLSGSQIKVLILDQFKALHNFFLSTESRAMITE